MILAAEPDDEPSLRSRDQIFNKKLHFKDFKVENRRFADILLNQSFSTIFTALHNDKMFKHTHTLVTAGRYKPADHTFAL